MKATVRTLFFATALMTANLQATNVGLSTIEQPVNLGAASDPARIPLGAVATESNYHYGRGPVITAPRPALHGAMEWKSGIELNQNLASVFGIRVSDHDAPHSPVTIHLKDHVIPPYSPYLREQVLAATIHCLLRSNGGRPSAPIKIEIIAESPADQEIAAKYAGDYINTPENHDEIASIPETEKARRLTRYLREIPVDRFTASKYSSRMKAFRRICCIRAPTPKRFPPSCLQWSFPHSLRLTSRFPSAWIPR